MFDAVRSSMNRINGLYSPGRYKIVLFFVCVASLVLDKHSSIVLVMFLAFLVSSVLAGVKNVDHVSKNVT